MTIPASIGNEFNSDSFKTMQYQGLPFKIACLHRWVVVVSGPQAIEEYRQVPDNNLSMLSLGSEEVCINSTRAVKYLLVRRVSP